MPEPDMPIRLAVTSCEALPGLYRDDLPLREALERRGVEVTVVVWNRVEVASLAAFSAVLVRSPWDWFLHREAFRAHLAALGRLNVPVFNAPPVLERFADKRYLVDLAAAGVPTVPTVVLEPAALPRAAALARERSWSRVVLKPAFTANAHDALRLAVEDVDAAVPSMAALPPGEVWLLQPFLPQIDGGELSFVFIDGAFTHVVRKRPRPGDWRVQLEHGGTVELAPPEPALVAQASRALAAAAQGTLYARVDGVVVDGVLHVMELELVEPMLYLEAHPPAAEALAGALVRRLGAPGNDSPSR